ncbi:hypothetical protein, partial [Salmonella sp. SAL04286]|uniref:hypothetical protein n=1 Tax=Salmonella sp. SAL04286 TaxID=3159864 RepID=UPI00397B7FC7
SMSLGNCRASASPPHSNSASPHSRALPGDSRAPLPVNGIPPAVIARPVRLVVRLGAAFRWRKRVPKVDADAG